MVDAIANRDEILVKITTNNYERMVVRSNSGKKQKGVRS